MSPVKLRLTLPDPEISYQLYKNSKRHGGICHFSDRFDGSKKPARDSAGPFLRRGPARASALAALKKRQEFPVSRALPSSSY